jgi:branched-chain amino acid transport system ATP-binding protein
MAVGQRLLLLDEPTAGLSVAETRAVTQLIAGLSRDVTVLLIEHDMDVAFEVADWFTVLHQGAVVADGPPDRMRNNPTIQEIYFGAAHSGAVGRVETE